MNKDNIIRLAMVGCGEISHTHAQASKNISNVKIIACCDIDKTKAESWKNLYDCENSFSNMDEMLENNQIDGVILATWPIQHLEQIEKCITKGVKNILCEKSISLTGEEALKIYELARQNNAFIMEACKNRHHPAIRKIEQLIKQGAVGLIDNITAVFSNCEPDTQVPENSTNWRYKKECGGGVPYDWVSYLVNACNYFSGSIPKRVFASGTISKKYDVITRLNGMIEYENGIVANIVSSKDANFSQLLQITGSDGILKLPVAWGIFGNVKIEITHRQPDWPYILTDICEVSHLNSFELQLKNFVDCMNKIELPVLSLKESVINVYTIEGLCNSVYINEAIDLDFPYLV